MMDWTDRHCRYFHRLISPNAILYTEMVTTGAILHGPRDRLLTYNEQEHPVALQLGGSDAAALAACAKIGEDYGYDEINLNCGCPSDRVQNGSFGACLMKEPATVAACVEAMRGATALPVTVKCRIGVDDCVDAEFLERFLTDVMNAGCDTFIIHARKAWLKGLSPKENREVPPLNYGLVAEMKAKFPHLTIILNGGITTMEAVKENLQIFDGVMIGREAYQNPWFLREIEREVFGNASPLTREDVARAMIPYMADQAARFGTPEKTVTRHILGLYNGLRGGKAWRRALSERMSIEDALAPVTLPLAV